MNNTLRILTTCLSASWGGMEMFVISSLKLLLNNGYKLCLACLEGSPIEKASRDLEIERVVFPSSSLNLKNIHSFINDFKINRYDLIHTHYSKDLWLIVPSLQYLRLSTPVVMTKHLGSAVSKKDFLHRCIYKRLDHAIAISDVIRQNILQTTILSDQEVSVIYNFIDNKKFSANPDRKVLHNEYKIDKSSSVLGMVGRITPGKGHEDVINAIRLINKIKPEIKVVIIGSAAENEKDYEERLKSQIKEFGLENNFIFTGFRDNIAELLPSLDIFLFPSHAEAFGLALLEAMSAGIPSIVCFSEGVKEIAIKDCTSLTYEKNDHHKLAEQILKLINNKDLQTKLSKNSVKRARMFNEEFYREEINKLYTVLLNQ